MRAVGYFREAGPEAGADSLASQSQAFLDYCQRQGYEPIGTFIEGPAGPPQTRTAAGFRQLVDFLRRPDKGFVVVVTPSWRALAPDPLGAVLRLFQLEGLGAQVSFLDGDADPADEVLRAWAERPAGKNLGERVRSAMRRRAVKGEVLGRPPYGYKVGYRRRLELVPEEAVVVRYIYRLYLQENLGIRLIARRLNEEGLKTRRGTPWSMVSIRDILRNRAYLGTYTRFGVRVPGTHPALVSNDEFRLVQERLSARRTSYTPRQVSPFLLSGLLYCGYCQNKLIGVSRRQSWRRRQNGEERRASYRYYQCESRTNQSICDYHTRRTEELEGTVRLALAGGDGNGSSGPTVGRMIVCAGDEAAVAAEWKQEAQQVTKRLTVLEKGLQKYLDATARGRLGRDKLRTLAVAVGGERLRLEEQLAEIEERAVRQASAAEQRREQEHARSRLVDLWETLSFNEKRALLRRVVDRIVVTDDDVKVFVRP